MTFQELKDSYFLIENPEKADIGIRFILDAINAQKDMFTLASCEGHDKEICRLKEEMSGDIHCENDGYIEIACQNEQAFVDLFTIITTNTCLSFEILHYFPFFMGEVIQLTLAYDCFDIDELKFPIRCEIKQKGLSKDNWLNDLDIVVKELNKRKTKKYGE